MDVKFKKGDIVQTSNNANGWGHGPEIVNKQAIFSHYESWSELNDRCYIKINCTEYRTHPRELILIMTAQSNYELWL